MTERSVSHETFTIERTIAAPPDRVFDLWSDTEKKRRWFVDSDGPEWTTLDYGVDFRVGGREHGRWRHDDGSVLANETVFMDIVAGERIVMAYSMMKGETRLSASLATVTFAAQGDATRMIFTEHGAFLDGNDDAASRRKGMEWLFDHLDKQFTRSPAK